MRGMWLFAAVVAAAGVGWVWWWVRDKQRLGLAYALGLPWWLWPLGRLVVHAYKREFDKDIYAYTWHGYDDQGRRNTRWYIRIRRRDGRPEIKIRLGRGFPQGDEDVTLDGQRINPKRKLVQQVTGVAGLGRLDFRYDFWFYRRNVRLWPKQVIPTEAPFRDEDVRELLERHLSENPTAPIQAIGAGEQPISVDMFKDDPHLGISAGTGAGKSAQVRSLMAQLLWANPGAVGLIADKKEFSQRGLAAVPGVVYARTDEEINNALVAVWQEIQRRNARCQQAGLGQLPRFPMIVLGLEEINVTYTSLNSWWRAHPDYDRRLAPGIYALDNILCCGRQVRVHAIVEGQDVNKRVLSGAGAGTVNIGVWNLAAYDRNTWNRLALGHEWIQPVSQKRQPGWCVTINGTDLEVGQRIWFTDGGDEHQPEPFEAYDWLMARDRRRAERHVLELLPQLALPARTGVHQERHPDDDRRNDHRELGEGRHRIDGETDTHDGSEQGNGTGRHDTQSSTRLAPVQGVDTAGPENHPLPLWDHRESQNHGGSRPDGFSRLGQRHLSVQAIGEDFLDSGNDGGIEYVTLREVSSDKGRGVLPMRYDALRKAAELAGFPPVALDDAVKARRRWSARALEDWFESRGDGRPGNYVVRPPGSATVKIGETKDLKQRLHAWNLGEHCVLRWIPQASKQDAQVDEQVLHERFAAYHDHLEWFWFCGELAEWLGEPGVRCGRCPACTNERVRA